MDSATTTMLPAPFRERSGASIHSPGTIRTRPHQMKPGGSAVKCCSPRMGNHEPCSDGRKVPP
jgi:hypothetical protein